MRLLIRYHILDRVCLSSCTIISTLNQNVKIKDRFLLKKNIFFSSLAIKNRSVADFEFAKYSKETKKISPKHISRGKIKSPKTHIICMTHAISTLTHQLPGKMMKAIQKNRIRFQEDVNEKFRCFFYIGYQKFLYQKKQRHTYSYIP